MSKAGTAAGAGTWAGLRALRAVKSLRLWWLNSAFTVWFHLCARCSNTVAFTGAGSSSGGTTGSPPASTMEAVSTGAMGIGLIGMLGSVGLTITWGSAQQHSACRIPLSRPCSMLPRLENRAKPPHRCRLGGLQRCRFVQTRP